MQSYEIVVRDGATEHCEGGESHRDIEAAHRSAVLSTVDILMDAKTFDGPLVASVAVHEASTNLTRIVRVAVLVSHMLEVEDGISREDDES